MGKILNTERIVAELVRFFEERADGIVAAYLFGSYAGRGAHADSDVDVAVLADRNAYPDRHTRFDLRVQLLGELMSVLGTDAVDVVMLNDAPPELGRRVVQEGVRVFASDEEAVRAYERDVQLRAADIDPFIRRARESLLRNYVLR